MMLCPDCGSDKINVAGGKAYCIDCSRTWRIGPVIKRRSSGEFRGAR
jgi:hypothetical protein